MNKNSSESTEIENLKRQVLFYQELLNTRHELYYNESESVKFARYFHYQTGMQGKESLWQKLKNPLRVLRFIKRKLLA